MQNPFMARAIELSVENVRSGNGGPFAAVVVQKGQIIAEGTNQVTSTNDPTSHAEIVAIRKACQVLNHFQLTGCEIYTTCEPCPMCMATIYWARPARVYFASTAEDAARFGFDDDFIGKELRLSWSQRKLPMTQIMRKEALAVFPLWEQKTDKIKY